MIEYDVTRLPLMITTINAVLAPYNIFYNIIILLVSSSTIKSLFPDMKQGTIHVYVSRLW